jgi:cell division protein FtsI (penicillin-binding protein 3)
LDDKNDILIRMRLVYFLMVLGALLIIGKVLYIQFVEGDHWRDLAQKITMRYISIDAARGDICADDGRLLATSVPIYEIRMDMSTKVASDELFYSKVDSLALCLSRLFGDRTPGQYRAALAGARKNQNRYYLVKRNVSHNELMKLRQFPLYRLGSFRGGIIEVPQTRREMPYRTMAARTIGYERAGVYVGLEGAYRESLEGTEGQQLVQRISGGSWMPVNDRHEIDPQNGKDLITTINIPIQDITEKALLRQMKRYNAAHGTAIVMEVKTGKIKAISNLMLNEQYGTYEEAYNFAIGYSAEPGSTFKLPALMVALEDGKVKPDDVVETGNGEVQFYGRTMRDADDKAHGQISVKEAFSLSSNVGISTIIHDAYKDNPQAFVDGLKRMRLHEQLGLEITGEGTPVIRDANSEGWSKVSLPWMAIGYEVALTPLQLLGFYNAIANDGRMMKPMLVTDIRQAGRTIKQFSPTVLHRSIASAKTLAIAREMLIDVVENGTASNIKTDAYRIAGKTGTAQVAQTHRGYRTESGISYQASFAGYFPADNPVYSCIVVINDPKGWVYYGSIVAAPVFREIADKTFAARMFLPAVREYEPVVAALPHFKNAHRDDMMQIYTALNAKVNEEPPSVFAASRPVNDTVYFNEKEFIENLVPEVIGMSLSDAIYVMENVGLRVRFTGKGTVRRQSIRPGKRIREGSIILLELS